MKYLLLMHYGETKTCSVPMHEWAPQDMAAHIRFQNDLGAELTQAGEFVDGQGLAGTAKTVISDGAGAPVITDGPFPESKELLAGYWMVDVDNQERALEIAAKASSAPGPGGVPLGQPIQVRALLSAPVPEL